MPKDLFCPLEKECKIYNDYLKNTSAEYSLIIRGSVDGYSCRAINILSSAKRDTDRKDCALIQVLNNTDALLNLSGKREL